MSDNKRKQPQKYAKETTEQNNNLLKYLNFFIFYLSAYCYSLFHSTPSGSALAKLKASGSGGLLKPQPGEKKETPQERLKRIMNKQLNKQSMTV